ncbi:NAD(P)/FAD-dependent oxidoreductase [Phosphitispora fastidiosa]|uniref:NAD(P)/FAD-dependent oxidoreductase n=1 Tax=Phosphitispora fastidiosa TaxID=2837202 RepID=UPI001E4B08FE|nr:NAD(P)H-nitrite reductase large subunit [Phosphitispora fastidiosa]
MHYVIIGASAAGISAAETLVRLEPDAEITVVSREKDIAYSRCLVTYYISGQINRDAVFIRTSEQLKALGVRFIAATEAVGLDAEQKHMTLSDSAVISYDRLLAASGASPVIPDIKGIIGQGVYTLRTIADADSIIAEITESKAVAILGDGLVAVTAAIALNKRGMRVSLVGIAPHILAGFLDSRAAGMIQDRLAETGIRFYLGKSFNEVNRDTEGRLNGVILSDGTSLEADMALVAAGVKPELKFFGETAVAAENGLLVDEYMETSIPGIYAAGDVVQAYDVVRNAPVWNPLWPNAVEQGRFAALNMAGRKAPYRGSANMNSLNIGGIPLVCAGIANSELPDYESFYVSDNNSTYEKLVFRNEKLAGFILLGKTEKSGVLTSLLRHETISPTQKAKLLRGDFSYTALTGPNH